MFSRQLPLFLLLLTIPGYLYSQPGVSMEQRNPLKISKLSEPINFDGIPNEEAWKSIEAFNLVMHIPVFGKVPTENTDVRLADRKSVV